MFRYFIRRLGERLSQNREFNLGRLLMAGFLLLPFSADAQFQFATNNGVLTITQYTGPGGAVVIPSTVDSMPVVTIGENSFLQVQSVTSVTIPNSVTNIGHHAFTGCSNLVNVTLPSSLQHIAIAAFSACTSLGSIQLPNPITKIENSTFENCHSLTNIIFPASLTEIGWHAFEGCSSLRRVSIPQGVLLLGVQAFNNCANLESVILPKSLVFILQQAFANNPQLKEVYVRGNAPGFTPELFDGSPLVKVYYLPGTTGWTATYSSRPAILWNPSMQPAGPFGGVNPFRFLITGTADIPFVIEATTNLSNAVWIPVQTNTLTDGSLLFTDLDAPARPQRFYRVRNP